MSGQLRFRLRFRACRSACFDFLFLSISELTELAETSGWEIASLHDDEDGRYAAMLMPSG